MTARSSIPIRILVCLGLSLLWPSSFLQADGAVVSGGGWASIGSGANFGVIGGSLGGDSVIGERRNSPGIVFALFTNALSAQDRDEDGMPDDYETANGLNPNTPDSYFDPDGDRSSNFAEFIAGTDPRDPFSVFKIRLIDHTGLLKWDSVAGRSYLIEKSPSLLQGSWTAVGSVTATGPETQYSVTFPSTPSQFYRVTVGQP